MSIQDVWKVHSIEEVPPGGNAGTPTNNTIAGLTSVSMPVNANATKKVPSGEVFATTGYLTFTTVDLQFTSTQAKKLLDLVGVRGACIAPGGNSYNVYVAKYACNGPVAGAVHRMYTITKGMLYLTSASCNHQADLEVSAQLQAVFDGTNAPVAVTDNVALPNAVQVGDLTEAWTLSEPASNVVGGANVGQKTAVSVDMGVTTSTLGADSDPFDSFASIDQVLPVVSATGLNPLWFDALGLTINGKLVTHAGTWFKFRKRDGAGGFIAPNVAQHIGISAHGPAYFDQLVSGNGQDAASTSLRIECLKDAAGNAPLIIDTAIVL